MVVKGNFYFDIQVRSREILALGTINSHPIVSQL